MTKRADGLPMEGKTGTVRLALAAGVPIVPMVSWGSAPVWQKSGPGSLRPGRPVWVRVGDPITLEGDATAIEEYDVVVARTQQVMDTLTSLTVDLRDRYPADWRDR